MDRTQGFQRWRCQDYWRDAGSACGLPFRGRALTNPLSGASRTFVVADPHGRVFGYYAMAAGAVSHQAATSSVRRNMPDPVPVMVLARLAVDQRAQGIQLGAALLQDAVHRAVAVSLNAGVRALLVHALHEEIGGTARPGVAQGLKSSAFK